MVAYLDISLDLSLRLPALEAQTQTLVVYGGKGMGKSNFTRLLAEQLARHRLKFALIDPLGVNWGLKHSADGKGEGIEVLILGGIHADLPIEPTAGAVVADFVVDEEVSVVIDISRHADGRMWSHGERIRFVRDYCTRLFERQGERRRPVMLLIDEAGRFVPQNMRKGDDDIAGCVGAIEQLVEWGRNVGVGVALITQRSARMNKSVSELADMMIAFRTIGPNSIDAIIDWFGEHVPKDRQKALVEALRKLKVGHALVVSPGWLEVEGEYTIAKAQTFDSSATPRAGQERRPSGKGTVIDLGAYRNRMAETVEKAEAHDPRKLQARVTAAEKQKKTLEGRVAGLVEEIQALQAERDALAERVSELEDGGAAKQEAEALLDQAAERVRKIGDDIGRRLQELADLLGTSVVGSSQKVKPRPVAKRPAPPVPVPRAVPTRSAVAVPEGSREHFQALRAGARRMVDVLVENHPMKFTLSQLAVMVKIKKSGGTWSTYWSEITRAGYVEQDGKQVWASDLALAVSDATPIGQPASTEDVLAIWRPKLREGARRMLDILVEAYPEPVERAELAERAELDADGGTFSTYLSDLTRNNLIVNRRGQPVIANGETLLLDTEVA